MLVLLELFFWTKLGGWKHYAGFLLLPWTSDSKSYFEEARGKESGGKFTTPKSHFSTKLRCEQSCSLDSQPQSYYRRININKLVRKIKTKQKHLSKINSIINSITYWFLLLRALKKIFQLPFIRFNLDQSNATSINEMSIFTSFSVNLTSHYVLNSQRT